MKLLETSRKLDEITPIIFSFSIGQILPIEPLTGPKDHHLQQEFSENEKLEKQNSGLIDAIVWLDMG